MKISGRTLYNQQNILTLPMNDKPVHSASWDTQDYFTNGVNISFGAIQNVKKKKVNIEEEKNKFIKRFDELLKETSDEKKTQSKSLIANKIAEMLRLTIKKQEVLAELEAIANNKTMSPQAKLNQANMLKKKMDSLCKPASKKQPVKVVKKTGEAIDLVLINKFRSAFLEDDFNLQKVFNKHYSALECIHTVKELKRIYPKIKVPQDPAEVVAKKIAETLTRDFYEKLIDFKEAGDSKSIKALIQSKVVPVADDIAQQINKNETEVYTRISQPFEKNVISKLKEVMTKGLSICPQNRKSKDANISRNDLDLLSVDFDEFVLDVVKKQYIDNEKLNNILYEKDGIRIRAGLLKEPEYKFEKVSDKVKTYIKEAAILKAAQRDYENFETKELQDRLLFFTNHKPGDNEALLSRIIDFNSCDFDEDDKNNLRLFLMELDLLQDEEKSADDVIKTIENSKLIPLGTERRQLIEREQLELQLREQKKIADSINQACSSFDSAMNILYKNDLSDVAIDCLPYRPVDLEKIKNSNFIVDLVQSYISGKNITDEQKEQLESSLTSYLTFCRYEKNATQPDILKQAVAYATDEDGVVDKIAAGDYIFNYEIVDNYPNSMDIVDFPAVLEKIMTGVGGNKDKAVKYLMKYNDYQSLPSSQKYRISTIQGLFSGDNEIERFMLKHLIEEFYIKNDTKIRVECSKSYPYSTVVIPASAKNDLYSFYNLDKAIELFKKFENASSHSAAKGSTSSGIKYINTTDYPYELKIGDEDRLLSLHSNPMVFSVFNPRGLHKSKDKG